MATGVEATCGARLLACITGMLGSTPDRPCSCTLQNLCFNICNNMNCNCFGGGTINATNIQGGPAGGTVLQEAEKEKEDPLEKIGNAAMSALGIGGGHDGQEEAVVSQQPGGITPPPTEITTAPPGGTLV